MPLSPADDFRRDRRELIDDIRKGLEHAEHAAKALLDQAMRDGDTPSFRYSEKVIEGLERPWQAWRLIPKQPT